jgi:Zn finger protein HypA/HybF involved in hydrogenase expression
MTTVAKCENCNQFNQEAEDENDLVCARCKFALENLEPGAELPDRDMIVKRDLKGKQEKVDGDEE